MGYVSTWMGDRLSSRPAVGCVWAGISLCLQTFVNSSALLVSLMALCSRLGPKGLVSHNHMILLATLELIMSSPDAKVMQILITLF